jgi:hypothetical protein
MNRRRKLLTGEIVCFGFDWGRELDPGVDRSSIEVMMWSFSRFSLTLSFFVVAQTMLMRREKVHCDADRLAGETKKGLYIKHAVFLGFLLS